MVSINPYAKIFVINNLVFQNIHLNVSNLYYINLRVFLKSIYENVLSNVFY